MRQLFSKNGSNWSKFLLEYIDFRVFFVNISQYLRNLTKIIYLQDLQFTTRHHTFPLSPHNESKHEFPIHY